MKVGWGAGTLLADIEAGMTREEIRARWKAGEYGQPHERPRPDWIDFSLKMKGR